MNSATISTPGVYINQQAAFASSVVPVATAVPAFIGYTPQAVRWGKSYSNVAHKINSLQEFLQIYCLPDNINNADPVKQYNPQYYLTPVKSKTPTGNYITFGNADYAIVADPDTIYFLYNSVRLFYLNGGGPAYIVSVGSYGKPSGYPARPGENLINKNIVLADLQRGLNLLLNQEEPTMYVCPDATLLSVADNGTLMQSMLMQCAGMQTAISIFDVIGGKASDPLLYTADITSFRQNTGTNNLQYGTAYYPFIGTTIMQASELNYTNLFGGDVKKLEQILSPADNPNLAVTKIIAAIQPATVEKSAVNQYHNDLLNASPVYKLIMEQVLADANILPPSGGLAGVMTLVDSNHGVWQAPANVGIAGAVSLPVNLTEIQQGDLNIDPLSGKSINAIRSFNGLGILVWGARTLDGNSQDWKFISIRRTMTMIEQSCKRATQNFVFAPNVKSTWITLKVALSDFLTQLWKEGCLLGALPTDSFSVDCDLGTTMTAEDIQNGFMVIAIKVALAFPAEYIAITFKQQMADSV
jgi:phage tail sheath protein FI